MYRLILAALLLLTALGITPTSAALDPDETPAATRARRALAVGDLNAALRLHETALATDPQAQYDGNNYPYQIELPPDVAAGAATRYPLILLLHGRGADGASMERLAHALALDEVIFAWVNAPYAVAGGGEGFEYWPRWVRQPGQEDALKLAAELTARSHAALVRDAASKLPVDTTRVFIVGFSQGAAATYIAALESPTLFAGIAPLGGYVLVPYADPQQFADLACHDVALFIGHGSQDQVVPPARAEEAAALARAAGVETELRIHPIGHTVSEEMIRELAVWLGERIHPAAD